MLSRARNRSWRPGVRGSLNRVRATKSPIRHYPREPFRGGLTMEDQNRMTLVLSAVALAVAIVATITMERVNMPALSNDAAPGTVGLARPHPPLDRAAGEPIQTVGGPSSASIRGRP